MVQVTIFAQHEGQLRSDKLFYLTMFGTCELTVPTGAKLTLMRREQEKQHRHDRSKPFFLTLFGQTEIKLPTIAEEYLDLRQMIDGGLLTLEEWELSMAMTAAGDGSVSSFTMFAGFEEGSLPSENSEIDSLALHRHLGNISEASSQVLQYGIGQPEIERLATLRRALLAAA